jgi:cysteine desulfurase/selenocysteine lyase
VLVVGGDYPATVLPFLRLAGQGVVVHSAPRDRLADAITPRTRVVAVTWVDSFTGTALDVHVLGTECRSRVCCWS